MTTTKHNHTLGPWRESDQDRGLILAGKNGLHIAQVAQRGLGFTAAANARLIAAAPELLKALEAMRAHCSPMWDDATENDAVDQAFELAIKAIAKAQGEV